MKRHAKIFVFIAVVSSIAIASSWLNSYLYTGAKPAPAGLENLLPKEKDNKTTFSTNKTNTNLVASPLKNNFATTIALSLGANANDSEENIANGAIDLWSSDLELTYDNPNSRNQIVALRYESTSIPAGSTIDNAYITFAADETSSGSTSITFWAEDIDNSNALTTTAYNLSSRTKTSTSVDWNNIPAWNTVGQTHDSPELKTVIQEVVDRSGWISGNTLTILIEGSGSRTAESYGGNAALAPVLHITYTAAAPPETCYSIAANVNGKVFEWYTNGGFTNIGTAGAGDIETMTMDGDCNTIHAIDGFVYGTVSLTTGVFTAVHTLTSMEANGVTENISDVDGLAIDDNTGYLWAIERKVPGHDLLFQINPETGQVVEDIFGANTDYVELTGSLSDIDDIAFNPCTGELFGVSTVSSSTTDNDQIVKINTTTGALTVVATLDNCDIEGLTFNDNCELYGSTGFIDCISPNSIFKIDVANDTSYLITAYSGGNDIEAVVCCVTAPIPQCDNFTSAGTIGYDELVCIGDDVSLIQNVTFPSGGVGGTEYIWMSSTSTTTPPSGPSDSNWTIVNNETSSTYDPSTISAATSYARLVKRDNCTSYLVSNVVTATPEDCGLCTDVTNTVSSFDDAEENLATGGVSLYSSDLELTEDVVAGTNQIIGMRFTGITIPTNAIISTAHIEFEVDHASIPITNLTFWAQDIDDAPTFANSNYNISNRTKTSASVDWLNVSEWDVIDVKHNSPNLATLIQEVVDRPGWLNGNDIVFLVEGNGTRAAKSFNGSSSGAPKLVITHCESTTYDLSGRIYEDINYGGGDGRSYSESNTSAQSSGWSSDEIGVANAIVELYDNAGNYITNSTTDGGGNYTFTAVSDGDYQVRVVNESVESNRGSNSTGETIVPVQTFRSNSTQSFANEVGGADPSLIDASENTSAATLSSLTSGSITAQSVTTVTISGSNEDGVDFGYNFNTIVNTNDSGQGSLRQFIINSNELVNNNLDQEDAPTNGVSFPKDIESETSIFMIPGSGVHTINPLSGLDAIEDTQTHLTGYTQQGSSQGPINSRTITVEIEGNAVTYDGVSILSSDVQVSGLSIHSFRKGIRSYKNNTNNNFIWGNYIGTESDGLTTGNNSSVGIELNNVNDSYIGTNADNVNDANEGNLASDSYGGIEIKSTSGVLVAGNYVGTDKNGTGDLGNTFIGIHIVNATGPNVIGFDDDAISTNANHMRNVSSGNGTDGIRISGGDDQVIAGNYAGTDLTGTVSIPNGGYGVQMITNVDNLILGTDSDGDDDIKERNIISGNNAGIRFISYGVGDGNRVSGNFIGTDVTGNTALPNSNNGIDISGDWTNLVIGTNGDGVNDGVEGNVISGNDEDGIRLADTDGALIAGNNIGVGYNDTANVGNGKRGIFLDGDASSNVIGYSSTLANQDELIVGNDIKYNDDAGIGLSGNGTQNRISRNQTDSNAGLGIDLDYDLVTPNDNGDTDSGPNDLLNFPVLEGATIIGSDVVITGYAPANSEIEFFITDGGINPNPRPSQYTKDFGEGAEYLFTAFEGGATDSDASTGSYTDDGTGATSTKTQNKFIISVPAAGLNLVAGVQITATATNSNNSTSEFSGWTEFYTCDPNLGCELVGQTIHNTCYQSNDGAFTVTGLNGEAPFEYSIDGGVTWTSNGSFTGLSAGTYTVDVRDANGCEESSCTTVEITEPEAELACSSVSSPIMVSCFGGSDGEFTVTGTGGTAPYEYQLGSGNFQSSGTFSGLSAGAYIVTIKDINDCTVACSSITIEEPNAGLSCNQVNGTVDISCFGGNDGEFTVEGVDGTAPYEYSLDGITYQASGTFSNLTQGDYTVTVKDANNCTVNCVSITVNEPGAALNVALGNDVTICAGQSTTLTAVGTGGTPGYEYNWSTGETTESITVTPGTNSQYTYTVEIKDQNDCIDTAEIIIFIDALPNVTLNLNNHVACVSATTLGLSGGTPANGTYSGNYVNGTTFDPSQAGVGVHPITYTYTNAAGCTASAIQNVIVNDLPEITLVDQTICQGDTITLKPEVCEPYVDIEAQRPLLASGWANVFGVGGSGLVGDGELCFTLDDANLTSANMFGLNTDPHSSNNFATLDFAIYILIRHEHAKPYLMQIREDGTSKANPYNSTVSYVGSTFCIRRTGSTIEYLMDGVVKHTSANASTGTLYYDHSIHSGNGIYTGGYSKFTDIALCGEIDFDYLWSTSETTDSIEVSTADTYNVQITDSNGCVQDANSIVTVNGITNPSATVDGSIVCDDVEVQLTALPTGLTYTWEGPNNYVSSSRTPVVSEAGEYNLTIYDSSVDCSEHLSVEVVLESQGVITGVNIGCAYEDILVDYTIDGSEPEAWIGLFEVGAGNSEFLVSESVPTVPGSGTITFSDHGLTGGTYEARLFSTSAYVLCESESFDLDPAPDVSLSSDGAFTCENDMVQLTALPTGMTYHWNGPNTFVSSSRTPNVFEAGEYTITVTDPFTQCASYDTIEVILESAGTIDQILTSCNNDVIEVDYSMQGVGTDAWIGIFEIGASETDYITSEAVPTIPGSGTVFFTGHGINSGDYEARLYATTGYIHCETEAFTFGQTPECLILGRSLVQANTQNENYTAPAGMSYSWSIIAGDAAVSGVNNGSSVSIDFGSSNSTIQLTITSSQGCSSTCTMDVEIIPEGQCNYRDEFFVQAFDNSDGTEDWSVTPWVEYGDDGDPIGGDIVFVSQAVRLDNDDNTLPYIERSMNLAGIANAILSFDYNQGSGVLESDDIIQVHVYDGTTWHLVLNDTGTIPPNSSPSIDISSYANADTKIKIGISSGYADVSEYVFFDNVSISGDCIVPEICDDGIDNDFDGLTDCEDPDCSSFVECVCQTIITNRHIYYKTKTSP